MIKCELVTYLLSHIVGSKRLERSVSRHLELHRDEIIVSEYCNISHLFCIYLLNIHLCLLVSCNNVEPSRIFLEQESGCG
jgi:hypothetical protein